MKIAKAKQKVENR